MRLGPTSLSTKSPDAPSLALVCLEHHLGPLAGPLAGLKGIKDLHPLRPVAGVQVSHGLPLGMLLARQLAPQPQRLPWRKGRLPIARVDHSHLR